MPYADCVRILSPDRKGADLKVFRDIFYYEARLHGDASGSVDRHHNLFGSQLIDLDEERVRRERRSMLQEPSVLDQVGRAVALTAIRQHGSHRGWNWLAAHVRSNDVHGVMEAEAQPERIGPDRRRWARHGSTRWLWRDEDVRQALHYVFEEQGEPMRPFAAEDL